MVRKTIASYSSVEPNVYKFLHHMHACIALKAIQHLVALRSYSSDQMSLKAFIAVPFLHAQFHVYRYDNVANVVFLVISRILVCSEKLY